MKKHMMSMIVLLGLMAGGAQASSFDYDQAWNGTSDAFSSQNDPVSFGDYAKVYDNFTLTRTLTVTEVSWTGGFYDAPSNGGISQFLIEFWSDNNNAPASLLFSETVAGSAGETLLSDLGSIVMYSYHTVLASGFLALENTQYWLSIQPSLNSPAEWGWASSNVGDGLGYQDFLGERFNDAGDRAFHLTTVPEPSILCLMALGLAAMAGKRRNGPLSA
ncbi:PEP-CTERM sorting domain-containing protein [Methylomonas sp. SURF-2]|uniref:PEP-CTERM sorting domain-containing protein n=1 Tax=Methylomonas subterranea TaxID=2952225 RepID=A0ABT1TDG9_9GAMM|nr:PEP-CTERM sorting domain-containing protein [Methylomonas sp. SURF-2]MCQ8103498.1 PEP-CTERM sorting domain-containing protein [Methylomonas sp. SURF-2]